MIAYYKTKQNTIRYQRFAQTITTHNTQKKGIKKMAKNVVKTDTLELKPIVMRDAIVKIVGDTDLVLNKMNDPTAKALTDQRKDKAKSLEKPNEWECIMTAMHWLKERV